MTVPSAGSGELIPLTEDPLEHLAHVAREYAATIDAEPFDVSVAVRVLGDLKRAAVRFADSAREVPEYSASTGETK